MPSKVTETGQIAGGDEACKPVYSAPMREFALLEHIYAAVSRAKPAKSGDGRVLIGPGDDMALIGFGGARLLAAVDQVVGGTHFDPDRTPMRLVGRKAVMRSLSDIAAMAARPLATLVAVTLPPRMDERQAESLFDAMLEAAAAYDCPLIGGDIAFAPGPTDPLVCSVTVLAEPGPAGAITRGGARAGDRVYVTGTLGGSLGRDLLGSHLTFEPRIREALLLAETLGSRLHAMIDLSDGLGRDASHIATASMVQIRLDAAALPRRRGSDWRGALGDGEDYELCFTAEGEVPDRLGDVSVTAVGEVLERGPKGPPVLVRDGRELHDAGDLGWEHRA